MDTSTSNTSAKLTTHPVTIASLIGSLLLIVGPRMDWWKFDDQLWKSFADEALTGKRSVLLFLGFLTVVVMAASALRAQRWLPIVNVLVGVFAFFAIWNERVSASDPTYADLGFQGMATGFWLGVVGCVIIVLANLAAVKMFAKK